MQLIIPIILIVLSGAMFVTWIDPQYKEIQKKQQEKTQYDNILAKTTEIKEIRDNITSGYGLISKEDLDRLGIIMPKHVSNIHLILDVNSVAKGRQMNISDIRINLNKNSETDEIRVDSSQPFGKVEFNFTVVTTYENFKGFLEDLASSLRIVDVESVEITPIEDEDQFYRFNLGISTYWLPKK